MPFHVEGYGRYVDDWSYATVTPGERGYELTWTSYLDSYYDHQG